MKSDGPIVAVPVKGFETAKERLAAGLDEEQRAKLSRGLSARTLAAARAAGAAAWVVTATEAVAVWARELGFPVIDEASGRGHGLDRAADAAMRHAVGADRPWIVLHGDLPLIRPDGVRGAIGALARGGFVVAASYDGGTSLLGGWDRELRFAYGPGSFHRHLGRIARAPHRVLFSPQFAIDVDTPADLAVAARRPSAAWLRAWQSGPDPDRSTL